MFSLKVKHKIFLGFGIITAILAIVITISYINYNKATEANEWNLHTHVVISEVNGMLESLVNIETGERGYLLRGKDEYLEPYSSGKDDFMTHYQKAKELTSDNPKQQERLQKLLAAEQKWVSEVLEPLISERRDVNNGVLTQQEFEAKIDALSGKQMMDEMRTTLGEIINEELALLKERQATSESLQKTTESVLVFGGLLGFILSMVIAFYLTRVITLPINQLAEKASIASGGDLTVEINVTSKDEVGLLAEAFKNMITQTRELVQHIGEKANMVASSAQQLNSSSQQTSAGANETAATMTEISSTVDEVNTNIAEMGKVAETNAQQAEKGNRGIAKIGDQMQEIAISSKEASEVINDLSQKSNEINQIVEMITNIADQTNLLALNAAIEAARAGEQGRGFAVVAEEVRKLAEQSANATKEIKTLISEIQAGSEKAVVSTVESSKKVEEGSRIIEEVGNGLKSIVDSIQILSAMFEGAVSSTQQMTAGVENVAASTEEQTAAIEEVSALAENLSGLSVELNTLVGKFKV